MSFHDPSARPGKQLGPGVTMRTFWGDKMLLALVEFAPCAVVPPHSHPHEQVGMVLQGQVRFTIGDETQEIGQGAVYVIPGDVPHSVVVNQNGARLVEVFSPVREDLRAVG